MMIDATQPADEQEFGQTLAYEFTASTLAWAFMRAVDAMPGWLAGYPSLVKNAAGHFTVLACRRSR